MTIFIVMTRKKNISNTMESGVRIDGNGIEEMMVHRIIGMKGNGTAQQRSCSALHAVLVAHAAKVLSFPLDEESIIILGL